MAFGNYAASSGAAATASTTLQVTCTANLGNTIALDGGTTTCAVAARAMKDSGAHQLNYGLYTSVGYSTVWGDGSAASVERNFDALLSLGSISFIGFGRVPSGQFIAAWTYTDRITVTVIF